MHNLEEKACPNLVQISNGRGLCCDTYYPKVGSILHRTYPRSKGSRHHRFQNIFLSPSVCSDFISNLTLLIFIKQYSPYFILRNQFTSAGFQVTPMLFVTHIEKEKGFISGPLTRLQEPFKLVNYIIIYHQRPNPKSLTGGKSQLWNGIAHGKCVAVDIR